MATQHITTCQVLVFATCVRTLDDVLVPRRPFDAVAVMHEACSATRFRANYSATDVTHNAVTYMVGNEAWRLWATYTWRHATDV